MERLIQWIFEQQLYWFILDNAGALMAITILVWLRGVMIHLSEIFAEDEGHNEKPLGSRR